MEGHARVLAEVAVTGRRLTRDETASRRALGEGAAEAGFGLRSLVSAHLSGARGMWPRGTDSAGGALAAVQQVVAALTAYFDSGCVSVEAARRLSLSVRALTYRLERIHKLTGADPSDPSHRYMLQTAVIGARLLDWPDGES